MSFELKIHKYYTIKYYRYQSNVSKKYSSTYVMSLMRYLERVPWLIEYLYIIYAPVILSPGPTIVSSMTV